MHIIANDVIKSSTLTASSTASGFSVDNLKSDLKASTWRSTSVSSQTITATWASAQNVNAVGIAFANFLVNSTVRVRLFTNTGDLSPIQDSGIQTIAFVYAPPAGFLANNLSSFAYGGGNYHFTTITQASIRKMEVIMSNPAGTDSFVEVSRIVAGRSFNPEYGARLGASVGFTDMTLAEKTDAGNTVIDRRPVSKVIDVELPALSMDERATMQEIARRNGKHTPIFISGLTGGALGARQDFTIYGTFEDLAPMVFYNPNLNSYSMRIKEI
ncbi:MAG: hypothetical protein KIT80_23300 [Chitinophagaceae bacterium]|nr:hypothetical protein [Nitrosomonas sp.]MCW5929866.1 hypothetical protein [Chitinophagaceae bacterium]